MITSALVSGAHWEGARFSHPGDPEHLSLVQFSPHSDCQHLDRKSENSLSMSEKSKPNQRKQNKTEKIKSISFQPPALLVFNTQQLISNENHCYKNQSESECWCLLSPSMRRFYFFSLKFKEDLEKNKNKEDSEVCRIHSGAVHYRNLLLGWAGKRHHLIPKKPVIWLCLQWVARIRGRCSRVLWPTLWLKSFTVPGREVIFVSAHLSYTHMKPKHLMLPAHTPRVVGQNGLQGYFIYASSTWYFFFSQVNSMQHIELLTFYSSFPYCHLFLFSFFLKEYSKA